LVVIEDVEDEEEEAGLRRDLQRLRVDRFVERDLPRDDIAARDRLADTVFEYLEVVFGQSLDRLALDQNADRDFDRRDRNLLFCPVLREDENRADRQERDKGKGDEDGNAFVHGALPITDELLRGAENMMH